MKTLSQFIKESLSLSRSISTELVKPLSKTKMHVNFVGDNVAIITDENVDLDAYHANVVNNILPQSETYLKNQDDFASFGLYTMSLKKSTVFVGPKEVIKRMYNDLKKDNDIKLTELYN